MPHANAEDRRAYYREWKRSSSRKKLSDKYYDAARHANRRAARWGCVGRITTADVRAILDGARCAYCGVPATEVDHVIALANGGPNTRANLAPACRPCNARKFLS